MSKRNRKYSVNAFSRVMLGLLAVFYVSVFVIQATHAHENLISASSQEGEQSLLSSESCKICAYLTHHEKKEIALSTVSFFKPIVFQAVALSSFEVTENYQTDKQDFTNRGPPFQLV